MPRISIVIPTPNNTEALETTLLSVLENRPPRSEIVVALGCVYEDPYDLKHEVRFIQAPERAQLVDLANCGIAAANSEVVHLLACGARVEEGWTTSALRHFDDPQVAAVAATVRYAARPTHVMAAGLVWTPGGCAARFGEHRPVETIVGADGHWIGPHLAGAFYRRSTLVECGGLDAALPADLAAIDLALRLRQAGKQSLLDGESKVVLDLRLLPVESVYRHARDVERLFCRHGRGVRSRLSHGLLVAGELLREIPHPRLIARLTGRIVGSLSSGEVQIAAIPPLSEPAASLPASGPARRVDPAHRAGEKRQATNRRANERRVARGR